MLCLWEGIIYLLQRSVGKNKQEPEEKKSVILAYIQSVQVNRTEISAPKCE